jgi:hypothetical protein
MYTRLQAAFSGKVETGFPFENATNVKAPGGAVFPGLSGSQWPVL